VDVVAAGGENRALDFWFRSAVRTHRIDGNDSTHRWVVALSCIAIAFRNGTTSAVPIDC